MVTSKLQNALKWSWENLDESGRRRPVPVEGSNFIIDADCMIMAIGTSPNPLIRQTTPGLDVNRRGCLIVDENEMTTKDGVYAGGDAVTGAATVISAMGAGKKPLPLCMNI